MKNLTLLLILCAFSCMGQNKENSATTNSEIIKSEKIKSTDSLIAAIGSKIKTGKRFIMDNDYGPSPTEDTLVLQTKKGNFNISPTGLFRTIENDTIQLKTNAIVEAAFLCEDSKYNYVFYTESDAGYAISWLEKISKEPLNSQYKINIHGFNLGQPIIYQDCAYVSAIGFVGKIDLKTGKYEWKHNDLYDQEKTSFNSFDTIIFNTNTTEFLSKNYVSENLDKVVIDNSTGKIKEIIK